MRPQEWERTKKSWELTNKSWETLYYPRRGLLITLTGDFLLPSQGISYYPRRGLLITLARDLLHTHGRIPSIFLKITYRHAPLSWFSLIFQFYFSFALADLSSTQLITRLTELNSSCQIPRFFVFARFSLGLFPFVWSLSLSVFRLISNFYALPVR